MNNQLARNILIALFALVIIGIPIWDKLSPMQDYDKVIESQYGTQFAWCVGLSFSSNSVATSVTRAYILIPYCFSNPRVVIVRNENNTEPSISESEFALFAVILIYGNITWGTVRALKRRQSQTQDDSDSKINRV
jgi:hypothetical protein